jgi:hypothetical protein
MFLMPRSAALLSILSYRLPEIVVRPIKSLPDHPEAFEVPMEPPCPPGIFDLYQCRLPIPHS